MSTNANPVWLSDHHTPRRSDTELVVLQKTLGAIIDGGGSGGSGAVMQGNGAPVAAPADPTQPAIYTDLDDGSIYTWSVPGQNWI